MRACAHARREPSVIDPNNEMVQALTRAGYKLAGHAYLQPGGRVKYTYVAKHGKTGQVVQGWSRGGDARSALHDLARRSGITGTKPVG